MHQLGFRELAWETIVILDNGSAEPPARHPSMLVSVSYITHDWLLKVSFLTAGLISAEKDKGEGVRALIRAAGASIVKDPPKSPCKDAINWLVVGSDAAADKDRTWCHTEVGSMCAFLTRTAFTDCLMQQSLEAILSS